MSDCANIEIRELLPDLLHETLVDSARARAEEHVSRCSDCAAELEVLRLVWAVGRERLPVDTGSIIAALPRARVPRTLRPVTARPLWRLAAVVTFVALGGVSVAAVQRYFGNPSGADTVFALSSPSGNPQEIGIRPGVVESAGRTVNLSAAGEVADLTDEDLELLIGALDGIEASPHADPDTRAFGRFVSGSTGGD